MTAGSILEEPVGVAPERVTRTLVSRQTMYRWAEQFLLALAAIFYTLHFVHLRADFPNHSPWMDWAKYTDEGWYGDAAVRHFVWGHWNVPGDFNPAAALPVWPTIELALFRVTGVSLVAARALTVVVFGLTLAACYRLVRRWAAALGRPSLAPSVAVLLLAVSPFCYAFTRMAILEPLLILLVLCGLLLADSVGGPSTARHFRRHWTELLGPVVLGCLLPIIVLTKTTGLFLLPAIFLVLWNGSRCDRRLLLRSTAIICGVAAALWGAYYVFFVRPHFLADYQYLFSANTYTKITADTFWSVLQETLLDGTWIGDALFWVSLIALTAWLVASMRNRLRGPVLPAALVVWVLGYAGFLAYHANLAPRYYLVLAVPLTLLLAMGFDWLLGCALEARQDGGRTWSSRFLQIAALGSGITVVWIVAAGARQTLAYVSHPEYTYLTAVHHLRDAIERDHAADPRHSRLVLSISGSEISLITGLPSICDDFGTMELPDRVAAYKPGWFAAWNDVEDDKMEALASMYRVVRVGAYPAYDDPERNLLILYRLDPLSSPRRGRSGRRRYFLSPHRRVQKAAKPAAASR